MIDGASVSAVSATCIFLVKYDSTGAMQWVRSGGSVTGTSLNSCVVNKNGETYMTGSENTPGTFGTYTIADTSTTLYVLKYASDGNVIWGHGFVNGNGNSQFVTTDNKGNLYITGDIMLDTISFGATHIALPLSLGTGLFSGDIVDRTALFKFDSSGAQKWCKVITGEVEEDLDFGRSVATDTFGNVYLAAYSWSIVGILTLDTITLSSCSGTNLILAKYDSSGNIKWAQNVHDVDNPIAIYASPVGNLFVTGGISGPLTFGSYTIDATNEGHNGIFLARLDDSIATFVLNPITGSMPICIGASISLSDSTTGGVWTSSDSAIATVNSATGVVTGIAPGIATISYTASGSSTTAVVTVNPAVVNSGIDLYPATTFCQGDYSLFGGIDSGFTWRVSNSTYGTYTIYGVDSVDKIVTYGYDSSTILVRFLAAGTDTIVYTVSNSCGSLSSSVVITINPLPTISAIAGSSSICTGSSVSLTDSFGGGVWAAYGGHAIINDTSGSLTGTSVGVDSVVYTITSLGCSAMVSSLVTVNTLPVAGTITGIDSVCAGSSTTLTSSVGAGSWLAYGGHSVIDTLGTANGLSAGVDSIVYAVTNMCGTATAYQLLTINPLAATGILVGPSSVCVGNHILITSSAPGGTWTASNTNATFDSIYIYGSVEGMDTLTYSVTNTCNTASATVTITINPLPNAGAITGPSSVCIGSTIGLTPTIPGGTWSATDSNATVVLGSVTGNTPGNDVILYSVTNVCGTDVASHLISVNPLPDAGTIFASPDSVCIGATLPLFENVSGGIWTETTGLATVDSTGVVTGSFAGTATISYTVTNLCGSASTSTEITINPLPFAGTIFNLGGSSTICQGTPDTLIDGAAGGTWSSSSFTTIPVFMGLIIGLAPGTATISYTVTTGCGTASATLDLTVVPRATAGTIVGPTEVCRGSVVILSDVNSGGVWSAKNGKATVTPDGNVTGIDAGVDSIFYTITGLCGTARAAAPMTVNALPTPVITRYGFNLTTIVSYTNYQWLKNGTNVPGATNAIYTTTDTSGLYQVEVVDAHGCSALSAMYHFGGLSVPVTTLANDIKIYPNPTQSSINIVSPTAVNAMLFSVDGRLLVETNQATVVDLTNLPNGIYLLTIIDANTGNKIKTERVIKSGN